MHSINLLSGSAVQKYLWFMGIQAIRESHIFGLSIIQWQKNLASAHRKIEPSWQSSFSPCKPIAYLQCMRFSPSVCLPTHLLEVFSEENKQCLALGFYADLWLPKYTTHWNFYYYITWHMRKGWPRHLATQLLINSYYKIEQNTASCTQVAARTRAQEDVDLQLPSEREFLLKCSFRHKAQSNFALRKSASITIQLVPTQAGSAQKHKEPQQFWTDSSSTPLPCIPAKQKVLVLPTT